MRSSQLKALGVSAAIHVVAVLLLFSNFSRFRATSGTIVKVKLVNDQFGLPSEQLARKKVSKKFSSAKIQSVSDLHRSERISENSQNQNSASPAAAVPGGSRYEQSARLVRDSITDPKFTADARRIGFRGTIIIDLELDENGRVVRAILKNPTGLQLDREAVAAARDARYIPAIDLTGRPVASTAELRFEFVGH